LLRALSIRTFLALVAILAALNSTLPAQGATNCLSRPSGLIPWWSGDGSATNLMQPPGELEPTHRMPVLGAVKGL
jgi:hypothetical protein